jgi:hypothetical protein
MSHGNWPYLPEQCPHCRYFEPARAGLIDDSGYEIPGGCRHPLIAMELFVMRTVDDSRLEPCRLFVERPPQRPWTV